MVGPNLNLNVDVNKCFSGLWKSGGQPKTKIKKLKRDMEKLKDERNNIKNNIEEAKREGRLATAEAKQWQRDLESLEAQVAAIFEDFSISFQNNIKVGPWGVIGDCSFDIGQSASQITKVRLHTGRVVDNLEISYVVGGKKFETHRLGGSGGGTYHTFELLPGEYINSMVGSVGENDGESCISQLRFKTNFGKTHGPFGEGGGKEFTVPVADGRIVGFFGQYDKYRKAIGVYVALN